MRVVGVDLSLTSTGFAAVETGCEIRTGRVRPKVPSPITPQAALTRLDVIVRECDLWWRRADLVVLEGISYGSKGRALCDLVGLHWIVRREAWLRSIPVAVVSPQARAKYATGSGTAGKDAVLLAVARRYPTVRIKGNDDADALVLAAMGARWLGERVDDLPKVNLEAMGKVGWPRLEAEAA